MFFLFRCIYFLVSGLFRALFTVIIISSVFVVASSAFSDLKKQVGSATLEHTLEFAEQELVNQLQNILSKIGSHN